MSGERCDATGLCDTTADDGPYGNVGTSLVATADNAPTHAAHDVTAATTATVN